MAKLSFLLFAAPLAAASATPALAADADGTERILVHYADLDLAKPAGRDRLSARVARAAAQVCGGRSVARLNLRDRIDYVKCHSAAVRDAERQLANLLGPDRLAASRSALLAASD